MAVERPSRLFYLTRITIKYESSFGEITENLTVEGSRIPLGLANKEGEFGYNSEKGDLPARITGIEYTGRARDGIMGGVERFTFQEYVAMGRKPIITERREFMGISDNILKTLL